MFKTKYTYLLLVAVLLVLGSKSQWVDCLKYIYSSYASVYSCQSTFSDVRPINMTGKFKVMKNMSWHGANDWTPYLHRDGYLIKDLYDQANCLCNEPNSGKLYAGKVYELEVKCTKLSFALVKGDFVYFDVNSSPGVEKETKRSHHPKFTDSSLRMIPLLSQIRLRKYEPISQILTFLLRYFFLFQYKLKILILNSNELCALQATDKKYVYVLKVLIPSKNLLVLYSEDQILFKQISIQVNYESQQIL